MQVSATTEAPGATDADTVAIGSFEDEEPAGEVPAAVSELLATGEASGAFKALALAHADGKRWLSVRLGARRAAPGPDRRGGGPRWHPRPQDGRLLRRRAGVRPGARADHAALRRPRGR